MALQIYKPKKEPHGYSIGYVGEDSEALVRALREISARYFQEFKVNADNNKPIEERLYEAKAYCKIETSKVAMYLPNEWRTHFFKQLDNLMDVRNWEIDDPPISQVSFNTFLRMLLVLWPTQHPGLGVSNEGNIIAAWTTGQNRLTIECLPNDKIRWIVTRYINDERESAAGITQVGRLLVTLEPFDPSIWYGFESK